jgi:hypothetical protein
MRPMKPNLCFMGALAVAALGAGCSSADVDAVTPKTNTGRGAVAGAAAGAVLGGIIGNNTSGNTGKGAAIGAAAGGLAGAAIGHERDQRATVSSVDTQSGYVVQAPPPSPTSQPYEQVPARPDNQSVWIPGHYTYTGSGYVWEAGRWEIPPAGMTSWTPPAWQPQGSGYVYVRGHWQ